MPSTIPAAPKPRSQNRSGKLVPMHELLQPAWKAGYAVPSFCAWNAELMETILQVAVDLKAPVILMAGPGEFGLNSPDTLGRIARALIEKYPVQAALHLDHGDSFEMVYACISAGFTSVMLDYSLRPFDENATALKRVVALARPKGITVEGEIGCVGKVDDVTVEGGESSTLTDPGDAARYAEFTGVDALAVSIGNAHGIYTRLPVFDFDRLEKIRRAVPVPLVLHGGSGTQPEYIRRAVSLGMAKINVASELCKAFRDVYAADHSNGKTGWLPSTLAAAKKPMAEVMVKWFKLAGAEGKGS
jgi:tagatose 1,6-diphosphate aldolase GatY/KbaY